MDENSKKIMSIVGINFEILTDLEGLFIPREQLLSDAKYIEIKKMIPELKKNFSSSFMTSLQKNACKSQKWPLLNLVRQILSIYNYQMEPIRKSDGYTLEGVKKYKRFFQIKKKIAVDIKLTDNTQSNIDSLYELKYDEISTEKNENIDI
jgi:hypothetical protein